MVIGDEAENSDNTTKPWKDDMDAMRAEIGYISYIVKNVAMVLAKKKKKQDNSDSDSQAESEEEERSREKKKNDDDRGLKLDIPEFNKGLDAEKFLDWIPQAERIYEYKYYGEYKQFKVATLKLTKYASLWYENLKRQRKKERKPKIDTWEKLKKNLMKRFLPRDYEQDNYLKLTSLVQESSSVANYIKEFEKLSIVCDLEDKEKLSTTRFIRVLNPSLAQFVEIQSYDNFNDVCRLALKFEKQDKGNKPYAREYSKNSSTYSKPAATASSSKDLLKEEPKDKALTIQELVGLVSNFVLPEPESKSSLLEEESANEEVHVVEPYSDEENEVLVIRSLHTEVVHAEEEQRERLFHSRCKVNNEICNLVVDSGSCTNVISRDLVDRLKLPTKTHPKPYNLHWLDKNNDILVKKDALVSLKLGPYEDKGKAKYNLKPLSPNKGKKLVAKESLFLEASEAEGFVARGELTYLLLVREVDRVKSNDARVQELLSEFSDVFPDELHNGLPPKREIKHHIDLIQGAALPNKLAYRCNHKEANELQRLVQELIDRGRFNTNFNSLMAPITELTKKGELVWTSSAQKAFEEIKKKLCSRPVLALLNVDKVFEVECDVLIQEKSALHSTKFDSRVDYSRGSRRSIIVHFRSNKTYDIVTEHFHRPKMSKDVQEIVGKCVVCQKVKSSFVKGLYMPLPVSSQLWSEVSMDFIHSLPRTQCGKDSIMVVVDSFTKMDHFISCHKTDDATNAADLYYKKIVQLHGIPLTIISDRDVKFLRYFWKTVWRLVCTNFLFSTSHHPQTDGQTKVTNRTLGSLLRGLVSKSMEYWDVKLGHAEFSYNQTPSASTGSAPFEIVYGINPFLSIDLVPIPKNDLMSFEAKDRQATFIRTCEQVKAQIEKINAKYKEKANKHKKQLYLRKERFPSKRKNMFIPRADGLFKVLECYGLNAYKLELPNEYGRVSAIFSVGDLSPYLDDDNLRANSQKEKENDAGALVDNENEVLLSRNAALIVEGFKIGSDYVTTLTWKCNNTGEA
ncbi:uncharacterized protein LOC141640187 [Silene latifolia]|uniref:uncharacterized protein LOC141640187 n=1 Tax=Silene latifolia TaxID=37657 RepID=UPI003D77A70D